VQNSGPNSITHLAVETAPYLNKTLVIRDIFRTNAIQESREECYFGDEHSISRTRWCTYQTWLTSGNVLVRYHVLRTFGSRAFLPQEPTGEDPVPFNKQIQLATEHDLYYGLIQMIGMN
jgi:hypothetical protein